MAKKKFKCTRCDRTFSMAAHLARHKGAAHGSGKKKAAVKKKAKLRKKRGVRKVGRPKKRVMKKVGRPKKRGMKRLGRPKGVVGRLGLRKMSLEQLAQIIDAARDEARRRLAELEKSVG